MTRFNRFSGSLLARLLAGYVLVTAVFAAAWLWSLYGPLTDAALRQQQGNLTAVAQSAALVAGQSDGDVEALARQLVARTDLRLTIIDADGTVMADSQFDVDGLENHGARPEVRAALAGRVGTDRRVSSTEEIEQLYVAVPASVDGRRVALRVAQPLAEIEAIAAGSRRFGLGLLAFSLVVAAAVAYAAARSTARPVNELTRAARRMAAGDLSVSIPEMPSDLEGLSQSLSELRTQIQHRLAALETERGTLRSTLDGLTDAVLVIEGGAVVLANRRADEMFRPPAGGWEGLSVAETNLPAQVTAALEAPVTDGIVRSLELAPDPTGRTLRVVIAPPSGGESGHRTIAVIGDITERARLDRIRRDFVANASHELKTPTAGIRLLAQAAEAAADDGDTGQSLAFTKQIGAEAERLQHLVNDLLDLSRLEAVPAGDAIADVREAVERATVSHRGAAARKGLSLVVDADGVRGGDIFVRADTTDLAVALDNLLDNAIAYTETGEVKVSVLVRPDAVEVTVSDTGHGIAPEHQPRVFERFYRVDRGRSRDAGGTGLGLALVRHVAERNGGAVTLTSTPGEGSSFTLAFPRAT